VGCPDCGGEGWRVIPGPPYNPGPHLIRCAACGGTGLESSPPTTGLTPSSSAVVSSKVNRMAAAHTLTRGAGRRQRIEIGLTLRELAEAVGVTTATLSRWENGQVRPRSDAAVRWVDALRHAREAAAAEVDQDRTEWA
jgi:DNA-binding transcriptional regulator YiaG